MSKAMRGEVLKAADEPVVVTERGRPILVVRNLLDDEVADEIIAQHPKFRASVERARRQKAEGQTTTLADLRGKYEAK
jgi:hypothetical protein